MFYASQPTHSLHTLHYLSIMGTLQHLIQGSVYTPNALGSLSPPSLTRKRSLFTVQEDVVGTARQYSTGSSTSSSSPPRYSTGCSTSPSSPPSEGDQTSPLASESVTMVDVPLHDGGGGNKLVDVVGGAVKKFKSKPNYREGQIYEIRNTVNDIVYIGATTQTLAKRFQDHKSEIKQGTKSPIVTAMRELGAENFHIHHVDWCASDNKKELGEYELLWIWKFKTDGVKLYNKQIDVRDVQDSGIEGVTDNPVTKTWHVIVGLKKRSTAIVKTFSYALRDKQITLAEATLCRVEYCHSIGREPVYTLGEGMHQQQVTQEYMERDPCPPPPPPTPVPRASRIGSCMIHIDQEGCECLCDEDVEIEQWFDESSTGTLSMLPLPDPSAFPPAIGDGDVIELLSD